MRLVTRILFGLSGFLAVAASVYWATRAPAATWPARP